MVNASLDPTATFAFARDATFRVEPGDGLLVETPEGWEPVGAHAVLLLQMFQEPAPLSRALERVSAALGGAQDVANLLGEVSRLVELGILAETGSAARGSRTAELASSFDRETIHIRMLQDRARTESFRSALRAVVRPGDVVLDIGTGTGVLAATAAQAGASKVFAVEAGAMAEVAEKVASQPQLAGAVRVIRGWSTAIRLERRADVLVTETIGDDPFGERIVEIVADAWRRHLVPGARVIPSRLRVLGLPVAVPRLVRDRHLFTPEVLARWQAWYGVPFRAIPTGGPSSDRREGIETLTKICVKPQDARRWETLAPPTLLAEVALDRPSPVVEAHAAEVALERGADCWGLLVFFEAVLAPGVTLSTAPSLAQRSNSWHSLLWLASPGSTTEAGARLRLELSYRRGNSWLSCRRVS